MNIIEIIRAQGRGAAEPVVPGETLKVEPGDRIRCEIPFTELTSASRKGDDLTLILAGLSAILFKDFFSIATTASPTLLSFQDRELTATDLNQLLNIQLAVTDAAGVKSPLFL